MAWVLLLIWCLVVPGPAAALAQAARRGADPEPGTPAALAAQAAKRPDNPLGIQARSALLMDARTGQILYAYNEHDRMEPASLAKMMTFDLALESLERKAISLTDKATVSEKAWRLALNNTLSNMFLEVGQQVAVQDLLYGLMVSSGNDAAVVLAERLGGAEENFARQMNEQAARLGLKETRYVNSHGLSAPDQYSTAGDMALLARHILRFHPEALRYTSAKEFAFGTIKQPNWNRLVLADSRVNGLKTGHLPEVGYHLVATARDRGMTLIAAILGTAGEDARVNEAKRLLDYGFNSFTTMEVPYRNKVVSSLPVYKGRAREVPVRVLEPPVVTVKRGREAAIAVHASYEQEVLAPVKAGQKLGRLDVRLGQQVLVSRDLVAARAVPRGGLLRVAWDSIRLFVRHLVRPAPK